MSNNQMDNRIQYVSSIDGNGNYHSYCGQKFYYTPYDRASEQAARDNLEAYARSVIAQKEKLAGRRLTALELLQGIDHQEDRDIRQKIVDENWRPTLDVGNDPGDDPNPFRRAMANGLHKSDKPETRKQFYERVAKEWDDKNAAEEAKARFDNDPRRLKAVAVAKQQLELVRFDQYAPQSLVIKAEQALRQAREGDLSTFKSMNKDICRVRGAALDERVANMNAEIGRFQLKKRELLGEEFEPEVGSDSVQ